MKRKSRHWISRVPREQSTFLKQTPAMKVRAVYQIIFPPNSTHPPIIAWTLQEAKHQQMERWILIHHVHVPPPTLYSSVILKKLSLARDTDIPKWKRQVARTHRALLRVVKVPCLRHALGPNPTSHVYAGHTEKPLWALVSCHEPYSNSAVARMVSAESDSTEFETRPPLTY